MVKVVVWETVPRLAVTAALVGEFTAIVFATNVADAFPAGTLTDAPRDTELELLFSFTTTPPEPAIPLSVTVPVVEVPPDTASGSRVTDSNVGGVMVRLAVFDTLPFLAVIVTVLEVETPTVLIANVAASIPAATAIDLGTDASALLLDSITSKPPGPVGPVRLIVPVDTPPPVTCVGLTATCTSCGGEMVSRVVCV